MHFGFVRRGEGQREEWQERKKKTQKSELNKTHLWNVSK